MALTAEKKEYLREKLLKINSELLEVELACHSRLRKIPARNYKRALNLLHYLVLRSLDIRKLQDKLHDAGLSSLASSESHVRYQILSVLQHLGVNLEFSDNLMTYKTGRKSLKRNSVHLFGRKKSDKIPSIMVTLDGKTATRYDHIKELIQSGMTIARINCAHDDADVWLKMIRNIRRASKLTGKDCKIYMDLAGPKIRTSLLNKSHVEVSEGQTIYLTDEEHLTTEGLQLIGCTIPDIVNQLKPEELVLFDDGIVKTVVKKITKNVAHLKVLRISSKKSIIKNEKGMNFPLSKLSLPALTEFDKECLPFILKHADMVGYSFIRDTEDLKELKKALEGYKIDLILKIETSEAVNNLPELIFYSMKQWDFGIMIARGDLAVEIGFERMSEIQEEILWICEAAHIPVIWATQVLQNLNKSGVATRSEITDAAHAAHADCVMINKGKHTAKVLKTLKDIIPRTGGHHVKKRFTFRPLSIARHFIKELNIQTEVEPKKSPKKKKAANVIEYY